MTSLPQALPRRHCARFRAIMTRWMDNDVYGHVNNVVYYSFFDTAVNAHLIEAGLRVAHVGASSVRYEVGLFGAGQALSAAAGHLVHVCVDCATRRPVDALPPALRTAFETLRTRDDTA